MEIFDTFKAAKDDRKSVLERETHWIQHYLSLGANLLNIQKNETLVTKGISVELPSCEEQDFFSLAQAFDTQAFEQKLIVKEIWEDGTRVYDVDFDVFFYLLLKEGAVGNFD